MHLPPAKANRHSPPPRRIPEDDGRFSGPAPRPAPVPARMAARHPRRRTGGGLAPFSLDISDPEWDRPGRPGTRRGPARARGQAAGGPHPTPPEGSRPAAAEGGERRYSRTPDGHRGSASAFSLPVAVAAAVVAAGMVDHHPVALADAMTPVDAASPDRSWPPSSGTFESACTGRGWRLFGGGRGAAA
jgi:hypothetical protein